MKKRIIVKTALAVTFCAFIACVVFAGGIFGTIRGGITNALSYDFEFYEIAKGIGLPVDKDSAIVEGDGSVEYYEPPVKGSVSKAFSQQEPYAEYKCPLVLTVKAACNGTVTSIEQQQSGYRLTLKNSFGVEIQMENIKNVYITAGQKVSIGQNLGSLDSKGVLRVSVLKDGAAQDPAEYF